MDFRASEFRLPKSEAGRRAWAVQTGVDGFMLLAFATADDAPHALRGIAALETLRQVWVQNFLIEHRSEGPRIGWRANDQVPPSGRYIGSPYDTEARYASKGATVWSGYKVHLTETCDDSTPNLITNVETTTAAVSDDAVTSTIHAALDARGLLPTTHVADTGFVNSALFVDARERYGIDLIGPTRGDRQWQAQADAGFAARDFAVDFAQQRATCPAGKAEPKLDTGTRPRHGAGDQDQVRSRRLPGLPAPAAVHALDLGTAGDHDPPRSPTRGATRRAGAGADCGLCSRICAAGRRRGHDCAGRALVSASANALLRAREDAPRPPDDGNSNEPRPATAMASKRTKGADAALRLCAAAPARGLTEPGRIRHQYHIPCCRCARWRVGREHGAGAKPARPYIVRFNILSRFIWPSAGLVVQGSSRAACTAPRSRRRLATNDPSAVLPASSSTLSRASLLFRRRTALSRFAAAMHSASRRHLQQKARDKVLLRLGQGIVGHQLACDLTGRRGSTVTACAAGAPAAWGSFLRRRPAHSRTVPDLPEKPSMTSSRQS